MNPTRGCVMGTVLVKYPGCVVGVGLSPTTDSVQVGARPAVSVCLFKNQM